MLHQISFQTIGLLVKITAAALAYFYVHGPLIG